MRIKAEKRGDWVVLQRDTGRGGQKREDGQKAQQGREEKEWRSTTSYVALPLCCDYSQRPYLRIGVFAAECGSVILKLDVWFFLMLKAKIRCLIIRCLIPQTLLCTWRKETAAGINDDDASSGKKVPIQDSGKMCGPVVMWSLLSWPSGRSSPSMTEPSVLLILEMVDP